MSSRFHQLTRTAASAALLVLSLQAWSSQAWAQSTDDDPEMRIQRLEEQLRQLTGQNEELQYRNRQLEDRLRQLQGGAPPAVAAVPPAQAAPAYNPPPAQGEQGGYAPPQPGYAQPQPGYDQQGYGQPQVATPAPVVQGPSGQRRGDAFDPSQNPAAPGAPHALGGGQLPVQEGAVGTPGGRPPGAPLELSGSRYQQGGLPPPPGGPAGTGALATAPPSNTPRDEYDLGIGYMQRKDYALAEQTMRNFAQRYPADPLLGDSQYWLGESLFQRQQYRDAAEVFLNVTSKFDKAAKAPDAMLRLGQSLAALKEKEAACAAFGEVTKKYPRASGGVKAAVDRELTKTKC